MSIKPLPTDVVAQIKSSVVITSLNNVICGLITNSLDAEATRINLTVDYARGNCSIEDNGIGLPPSEFRDDGGLGHLHYTSKYPPRPDIHGRHGIFLASVASLSLLSLASHHRDYHSHNSLSIHNSKVLARHLPCPPEQRVLTFNHGTRVTVRDLFGSMPVRVKYRALQGDKYSFSRDWDRLLSDLVALLLFWPGEASVSIREVSSRQSLTLRTDSRARTWINNGCRLLHQASLCNSPDASDWVPIGASTPRLSIDGYVCREPVATKRVQFISLGIEPLTNESRSNVLFEEVNRVFADSAFGAVDTETDSGGERKKPKMDGFTGRELKVRKGVDRWPMFFVKITATSSATKESLHVEDVLDDRRPDLALITDLLKAMFYEFLKKNHCRPKTVNLSVKEKRSRSEQNQKSNQRLMKGGSRSKADSKTVSSPMEKPVRSTRKLETPESRPESPFDGWSRIKSGRTLPTFKEAKQPYIHSQSLLMSSTTRSHDAHDASNSKPSEYPMSQPSRSPLYDANGKLTRKPFEDIDPKQLRGRSLSQVPTPQKKATEGLTRFSEQSAEDRPIEWINPVTKLATLIDPRTGFVMPPKALTLSRWAARQLTHSGNTIQSDPTATSDTTSWVRDLANNWENPVFPQTERPIPKLPDVPDVLDIDVKAGGRHGLPAISMGSHHEATAMGLQGRISRAGLCRAELVAQVDNKFILVKLPLDQVNKNQTNPQALSASSSMVLIDQHAADERCRVEGLMNDYFVYNASCKTWEAVTELLPKPLVFELSGPDRDVLCQSQAHFAHWGICYDVETPGPGRSLASKNPETTEAVRKARVAVRSLPPAILERCRTEPGLLSNLIRTEAWRLNDEPGPARQPRPRPAPAGEAGGNSPAWVSLFHGCPQGITELINSRSCRSAIMFNDALTRDQCADLLGRLVRCAFPFQCAHGRPSMVPLVDLGGAMSHGMGDGTGVGEAGFGREFKLWKGRRAGRSA
ncbi:hypothetical protein KVR01_005927 [Diaporthe batatas]|uniref:uncharacterized protein n=1 Tax=Diaporthe batatas TaxID=748121 RepID=UPI001D04C072|nr:uncharacterized protein KVR01_005927 [Diaporthe batatas]KAG8164009.1 hypothetical protein KVR01_005927 [Diaporthe batatas]